MVLKYENFPNLPSAKDLPYSDDTPVDSELQDLIPHLLKMILALIWSERMDWFFGIDMGIYYHPQEPAIVPDGFLQLFSIKCATKKLSKRLKVETTMLEPVKSIFISNGINRISNSFVKSLDCTSFSRTNNFF